jgi:hypothetical protein
MPVVESVVHCFCDGLTNDPNIDDDDDELEVEDMIQEGRFSSEATVHLIPTTALCS